MSEPEETTVTETDPAALLGDMGSSASEDDLLGKLEEKHGVGDAEPSSETATEIGADSSLADETPTPTDQPKGKETDQPSEKKSLTKEQEARREKALTALRRDKAPDAWRDKLLSGDEEMLAYAEARAEAQAEIDKKFDEHANLIRKAKGSEQADNGSGEQRGASQPPVQTSDTEPADALETFASDLRAELGDEVGERATSSLREWGEALVSPLQETIGSQQQLVNQLMSDRMRTEIQGQYPQVEDSRKWEALEAKADQLFKGGGYERTLAGARESWNDAAGLLFGKAQPSQGAPSEGSPPGTPSRPGRNAPKFFLTEDNRNEAYLDAKEKGENDRAKRILEIPIRGG